jgi:hypothetical protein
MNAEQRDALKAIVVNGSGADRFAVTFTDTKPPKLVLPDVPAHDDTPGLNAWVTSVVRFDRRHPCTGASHQGLPGADGHVELRRADAPPIRFEPAGAIHTARRFKPMLAWQLLSTDGEPYGFKDDHCGRIAHVLRLLCGDSRAMSERQETTGILGTFLLGAVAVEGCTTHGTGEDRYQAAVSLRPDGSGQEGWSSVRSPRYLLDANTGEFVIRVGDLQEAARRHVGSSLPRGWLDGRMEALGWVRLSLDGREVSGRTGRHSDHARVLVYRGHLPAAGGDQDA